MSPLAAITMTALALVLALLPVQAECVFVAAAWEAAGESQGTADARPPPRWLTGGQAMQTSTGRKKKKTEKLPVNIAEQLRSFGFH